MIRKDPVYLPELAKALGWEILQEGKQPWIAQISQDTRTLRADSPSLFFALDGPNHDGHLFLQEAKAAGAVAVVVEKVPPSFPAEIYVFRSPEGTLHALQQLARFIRSSSKATIVGITGSNGKTIVKEWAWRLISPDFDVLRSPGSYNSSIGVPLSLWPLSAKHQIALIEAGVSQPGDMDGLESMIQPDIGLWTHMGNAHLDNFSNESTLVQEKAKLFKKVDFLIYGSDHPLVKASVKELPCPKLDYGMNEKAALRYGWNSSYIQLFWKNQSYQIPWDNPGSVDAENLAASWALALHLGLSPEALLRRSAILFPVSMRLETLEGLQGRLLLNDTYSADLNALELALKKLQEIAQNRPKAVVLSDFSHLEADADFYQTLLETLCVYGIEQWVGIGKAWPKLSVPEGMKAHFFDDLEEAKAHINSVLLPNAVVLIKGARNQRLESLLSHLQYQHHGTQMEISMSALVHNLAYFRRKIGSQTKLMVMVKAASYGTGRFEVPALLNYYGVDYLAVAYPDEGVALRKQGINIPILVLNPGVQDFELLLQFRLEPELYSIPMLSAWLDFAAHQTEVPACHLKFNTGMNRLGMEERELSMVLNLIKESRVKLSIASVFSHLAASDDPAQDAFTKEQIQRFSRISESLEKGLGIQVLKHISNSGAIQRFPEAKFDMVRLGIALYGYGLGEDALALEPAVSLKSKVLQVRTLNAGASVGYGRSYILPKDTEIAVVSIGYADGLPRRLGNTKGKLWIGGMACPIVGRVCMDLTMIDVGALPFQVKPGMDVLVFGRVYGLERFAHDCQTIPYEVISTIHQRVPRLYIRD